MGDKRVFTVRGHTVVLRTSSASDVGSVRSINEDSYLVQHPVFLVADGMGGHAHGDRASQGIRNVFAAELGGELPVSVGSVLSTISAANSAVRGLSPVDASSSAIAGSTLTGVALVDVDDAGHLGWMVFNVGDSRVYTWHENELAQLTVDHSAVQELVDSGAITAVQAESHPDRNVVTRALGVDDVVEPDVWVLPVGGRQVFIACSDGLTKELPNARIAELLNAADSSGTFGTVAGSLVEAALEAGGADNITVVVVETRWDDAAPNAAGPSGMPAFLEETVPRG